MRLSVLLLILCAPLIGGALEICAQDMVTTAQLDMVLNGMNAATGTEKAGRMDTGIQNQNIEFDAILTGMTGTPGASSKSNDIDLNAVISGMQPDIDFDGILNSMNNDQKLIASVAESITISRTLDFINDSYRKPTGFLTASPDLNSDYQHTILPGGKALPVSGIVTSHFGYRPKFHRQHKGIDIALKVGDTVCAAMAGTVTRVDFEKKGYGLFVVMKHKNGYETRYAHLSQTLVYPGMKVNVGQPVALGGNTGNSTGPHLHFETRLNNEAFDPALMFDFSKPAIRKEWNLSEASYSDNNLYSDISSISSGSKQDRTTYVVRTGDTIKGVAKAMGIPVMRLCNLNMLSPTDALTPGRMLRLR